MTKLYRIGGSMIFMFLIAFSSCKEDDPIIPPPPPPPPPLDPKEITLLVPEDLIKESIEYWVILSTTSGQVLDVAQLQNNTTYKYTADETFIDDEIVLTYLNINLQGGRSNYYIWTYTGLSFDDYRFPDPTESKSTSGEVVMITFTDAPDEPYQDVFNSISPNSFLLTSGYLEGVGLWGEYFIPEGQSGNVLLKEKEQDPPKYLYLTLEDDVTKSLSDFEEGTLHTITFPGDGEATISISGHNSTGTFFNVYPYVALPLDNFEMKVYLPDGVFTNYSTYLYQKESGGTRGVYLRETSLPNSFTPLAANITSVARTGNHLTIETSGSFSYWRTISDKFITDGYITWNVFGRPASTINAVIPTLPEEITSDHLQLVEWSELNFLPHLYKSSDVETYEDFISDHLQKAVQEEYNEYSFVVKD